jgi:hypothetical protein
MFVMSCKDSDILNKPQNNLNSNSRIGVTKEKYSDNEMVLGKKLEIPYSLNVVEKAQNTLRNKNTSFKSINIKENYLYVRLLPKTQEEYDLINADSTIHTFEHPLDYEVVKQGNIYKDPNLMNANFQYIYCVIPVDKQFKQVTTEVLDKLYIPFGSGGKDEKSKSLKNKKDNNLTLLDDEILESTGYKIKNKSGKTTDWNPKGKIRVTTNFQLDNNFEPVEGCRVRTTKALVVTYDAITNESGDFYIDHSYWNISEVNYDIKWERADFDITVGTAFQTQAYFNGPKQKGDWNLDITASGTYLNALYAYAHKAAHYYYYKNDLIGIQAPPTTIPRSPIWGIAGLLIPNRMHLGVDANGNRAHYFNFNTLWSSSQIKLSFYAKEFVVPEDVFGTTCHELAHASHWSLGYTTADYILNANFNRKLTESWAQCVGWYMAAKYFSSERNTPFLTNPYPQNVGFNVATSQSRQSDSGDLNYLSHWRTTDNNSYYTTAFIDLIDNLNQNNCQETANNYSLRELERILSQCPTNWYSYRNKLESTTANPSEAQAMYIFNYYHN